MPRLAIQGLLAITATLWLSQPTLARPESNEIDPPTMEAQKSDTVSAPDARPWEGEEESS